MKGRDVLIGVAIGAVLVLFLVNYHSGKSTPHPQPSVTNSAAASQHKTKSKSHHSSSKKSHSSAAAAKHTPGPKPSGAAASATPVGQSRPTTASLPSSHHLTAKATTRTASAQGKSSGISDGLIVIACLIAIAAALSTVTMTVRGLRVAK
ncbi:MAG TPA: hypothetical protein VHY58_05235 [Streptosporangiaceae bacterium]|jgi:hypothetical protein|nr:hypothetical protein [Streptosporangiaceae bacterium]